jgi:20S proteasome subunit alpha 5
MFQSKSDYDRGVNTFSPEGRIFQIEYAIEAIKLGSTAVGIQTFEGVVFAAEKRITSSLLEPDSVNKVVEIDCHIGCVMSGLTADARTLVEHARVETQNHRFTFDEPMRVESCTLSVCDLSLGFGEGGKKQKTMSRPFGVSLLIGGVDKEGPALWHTDPSGTYVKYEAKSIGAGCEGAQTILQEQYHKSMKLDEAVQLCISILKQTMEEKLNATNVEVAVVPTSTKQFKAYTTAEIDELIKKL